MIMKASGPCNATQIAKATGVSLDVVEATFAELERRECVERVGDQDGGIDRSRDP
jgi:DNA-binding IscR family transcriptional regulator